MRGSREQANKSVSGVLGVEGTRGKLAKGQMDVQIAPKWRTMWTANPAKINSR
jgi:hypothetical protein